ncbi:MAG: carboxypeptidase regulatory-like domain-containing protein [Acidobacteriaceae bacterium]|nr:carboxypeptidase regulatory-like domain-containing protein [Acidobacteriaceae bacterium]MBV9778563.1 carboxypeptidase regulatory-like domain-containing protein [Acidobacteriaceae bacterium]
MIAWQIVRHRVALGGRITDEETGKPLEGVDVTIIDMPQEFKVQVNHASLQYANSWERMRERLDRTVTKKNGLFYFVDLPSGNYRLNVSVPGPGSSYSTGQKTASVSRDGDGNSTVVRVDFALRPTTVKGKVTGAGRENGVLMAEVRVKGSGERVFSNAQGQYALTGIEPGTRTVLVIARGFQPASQVVSVGRGALQELNFTLDTHTGSANVVASGASAKRGASKPH